MTPNVYFVELPCRIKGYVCKNEDDTHTIILNSRLSIEQNKQTYVHELNHIENNDFENKQLMGRRIKGWNYNVTYRKKG